MKNQDTVYNLEDTESEQFTLHEKEFKHLHYSSNIFVLKKLVLLFSKDAINKSKVTVKTL